jgi:hypothetical protein
MTYAEAAISDETKRTPSCPLATIELIRRLPTTAQALGL